MNGPDALDVVLMFAAALLALAVIIGPMLLIRPRHRDTREPVGSVPDVSGNDHLGYESYDAADGD